MGQGQNNLIYRISLRKKDDIGILSFMSFAVYDLSWLYYYYFALKTYNTLKGQ